jgi:hypothetical protein
MFKVPFTFSKGKHKQNVGELHISSSLKCAHAFQYEGLLKIITLHLNFHTFLQNFTKRKKLDIGHFVWRI